MARFRCHTCGREGEFTYTGKLGCPVCGSPEAAIALSVEEMSADDPFLEMIEQSLAEYLDDNDNPED